MTRTIPQASGRSRRYERSSLIAADGQWLLAHYVFAGGVKCPALFILGKRDVMTPPRAARTLQEQIPGAHTVLIDTSGHALMAEAPDAVLDALIGFLNSGPG